MKPPKPKEKDLFLPKERKLYMPNIIDFNSKPEKKVAPPPAPAPERVKEKASKVEAKREKIERKDKEHQKV